MLHGTDGLHQALLQPHAACMRRCLAQQANNLMYKGTLCAACHSKAASDAEAGVSEHLPNSRNIMFLA